MEAANEAFDRGNADASPPLYYDTTLYAELSATFLEAVEQVKVASQPPPEDPNAKKKGGCSTGQSEQHLGLVGGLGYGGECMIR